MLEKNGRGLTLPFRGDCVDFVYEDDRWRLLRGDSKHLSDELGAVTEVFLDQFRSDDAKKRRGRLVRDCLCEKRLSGPGRPPEDYALWRASFDQSRVDISDVLVP